MGRSTVIIHNQIKQFTFKSKQNILSTDLLLLLTSLSLSFESWMPRQTQHAPCLKEKQMRFQPIVCPCIFYFQVCSVSAIFLGFKRSANYLLIFWQAQTVLSHAHTFYFLGISTSCTHTLLFSSSLNIPHLLHLAASCTTQFLFYV